MKIDVEAAVQDFPREKLIEMMRDAAKNWLAHDGLWFLAVEAGSDMPTAIGYDRDAWERFSVVEARRIMNRHGIEPGGGLKALEKALTFRLYSWINEQTLEWRDDSLVIYVNTCRVQHARTRDGRPPFPCKEVGIVEYDRFARTIDPRIETRCLTCPPDDPPESHWCAWEFRLQDEVQAV